MGECIPLNIFKTYESGLKLYLDKDCTIEEKYDDTDKLKPFYTINIDNIRRGKKKTLVRYVKNIGINQTLFALYYSNNYNLNVWFADEEGNKGEYANGVLAPNMVSKVIIEMMVLDEDSKSSLSLHLAGREIKQN